MLFNVRELKNKEAKFFLRSLSGFLLRRWTIEAMYIRIVFGSSSRLKRWFQSPGCSTAPLVRQRVFRCPVSPLLYWSFKCNVELFHLQRCFSTQYKIPHHPSPPANQFTSSRSRRNKASLSSTVPPTHPPSYTMLFHVRSQ